MTIDTHAVEIIREGRIPVLIIQNGAVVDAAAAAATVLQIPQDELLGRPFADLFPPDSSVIVRSGRTIHFTSIPVGVGEAVFLQDISEQQEQAAALRRKTAELTSALESLPFDFWMNDLDNRTVLQNRWSKDFWGDQLGVAMDDVTTDPEILSKWRQTNTRALQGIPTEDEIIYTIQGEKRTFKNIVSPIREGGNVIGILGLNIDVTDYRKAVQERDNLLRELHHRTKNHLQIILSMINILRSAGTYSDQQILRRAEEQIHTISMIHEQLIRSEDHHTIELNGYFRDVTRMIGTDTTEFFPADVAVVSSIERAVPAGLALAELLRSVHETGNRQIGAGERMHASVSFNHDQSRRSSTLTVESTASATAPPTPVLTLIESLAGQIAGTLTSKTEPHLHIELRFIP